MTRTDRSTTGRPRRSATGGPQLDVSTKLLLCGFAAAVWGWLEASLAVAPPSKAEAVAHPIAQGLAIPVLAPAESPAFAELAADGVNATR
ncbi:MAG: hypothetical protein SFV21_05015 [Rhodospirillaceae bacterium]|nr:hypothetical protein [Rhodospirillaceae bacterium]